MTTYMHDSELQAVTLPPLVSTIHKSQQHPLSCFPACCIFTSPSLATASDSGDSSASRTQVLSSQPPVQNSTVLVITSQHGPHIKHCSSVVVLVCIATWMCILSCCIEMCMAWTAENCSSIVACTYVVGVT